MRWVIAILAAAIAGTALAQTPSPGPANPVVSHFRAYRAALDAGDLATAETEAEAALTASVARDGDGGRTAILAMNLAQVRLDRGRSREAYEPALRAFNIVSANAAASGLDPLLVRLAHGRAELAVNGAAGEQRLVAALSEAETRTDLIGAAHAAAADLGVWASGQGKFAVARRAWAMAGRYAAGSPAGATFALAEARVGEAMAIIMYNMDREPRWTIDTRISRQGDYTPAEIALVEAIDLMEALAHASAPPDGLTPSQSLYARALAWRTLMHARLSNDVDRRRLIADAQDARQASGATAPQVAPAEAKCGIALIMEPEPRYPPGAQTALSVGAVVTRIVFNETGQTVDVRVGAAVPSRWFSDAVSAVAPQWRASRAADNPPDCVMPRVAFATTMFTLINR